MTPHRLGLLGGTFDPPHHGHLIVAQEVAEALRLDRLLLIPAALPPHKQDRVLAPASLRLAMVRALLAEDQVLGVSEVELTRPGPSFTVDTLRYFRKLYPEGEIFFVMGVDQAATLRDWHEPEEVARLARLVVLAREGGTVPEGDFMTVPVTRVDISSSAVRARIQKGQTVRHLVPEGVMRIIEEHSLYQAVS